MLSDIVIVSGLVLLVVALAMVVTALVARRVNRVSVVDVTWGLALLAAAVVCAVVGPLVADADAWRSWLLAASRRGVERPALVAHPEALARSRRGPALPKMLGGELNDGHFGDAVRRVFVVQGVAVWLVSLPLQAAAVADVQWTWLVWAGVVVWAIGVLFESVGDAQLAAYRASHATSGPRSSTPDCGATRGTRTTSATPACGGASGSPAGSRPAGCRRRPPWSRPSR